MTTEADPMAREDRRQEQPSRESTMEKAKEGYMRFLKKVAPNRGIKVMLSSKMVEQRRLQKGSHVTNIPEITNPAIEVLEIYPVKEPYSYIRITFNNENSEYLYEVIEPEMNREEKDLLHGYAHGTNAYVVKPVDGAGFIKAVGHLGVFWAMVNAPPPPLPPDPA